MLRYSYICYVVFLLITIPSYAAIIHVPSDQPTIQAGIDAALSSDTVLLADGTYQGEGNRDITFNQKPVTVMSEHGAAHSIVDCGGTLDECHYGFQLKNIEGPGAVLSGLTIKNAGRYDPIPRTTNAIQIVSCSPTIKDCIITQNFGSHGAGICCMYSSPIISGCVITQNTANIEGAGIFCEDSSAMIINCTITQNTVLLWGSGGAGIHCRQSSDFIVNCSIHDNVSTFGGGGIFVNGIGPLIAYCDIYNNQVDDHGGGIYCRYASPYISNCSVTNNTGNLGAGIYLGIGCLPPLTNCLVAANSARISGGGLYIEQDAIPTLTNCTITGNSAVNDGGGMVIKDYASPTVINCIFSDNSITLGLGSEIAMVTDVSKLNISYSTVKGGHAQMYVEAGSALTWGPGMLESDPQFVTGPQGGYYLSQIDSGQSSDSPCVNTGSDLAGAICFTTLYMLDESSTQRWMCMSERSTRTDRIVDADSTDIGYHYAAMPTPTPVPEPSPTPYATPEEKLGVRLGLSKEVFHANDPFILTAEIFNYDLTSLYEQPLAIVLDVYGTHFWYPKWKTEVDFEPITMMSGTKTITILEFTWPANVGVASDIYFYAALLDQNLASICGDYAMVKFGWE